MVHKTCSNHSKRMALPLHYLLHGCRSSVVSRQSSVVGRRPALFKAYRQSRAMSTAAASRERA
jgi:hypothetical protein